MYPITAKDHTILGVEGLMLDIPSPQDVRARKVHLKQKWTSIARPIGGYGSNGQMVVHVRFDDGCKNGHQSFAITADITTTESRRRYDIAAGGCLHDEIARKFPELTSLIKFHLMDTGGPMHYIANTVYHAENKNFDYARSTAVWTDATDEELSVSKGHLTVALENRLESLKTEFRSMVESIGLLWEPEQ